MELRYGKTLLNFEISGQNLLGELKIKDRAARPLDELLKDSIMNPIGKPRLHDLLRKNKPTDFVILVSDITRSIADYSRILKFLTGEVVDAGVDEKNIEFVVCLGTHREHTVQENEKLYGNLGSDFTFSFHDCHNDLVSIGKTSTGLEVQVNKRVRDADFVIATGRIDFHYMAGFSGGRKAILPGISSYETIRNNHCKLRRDGVAFGKTENNIITREMDEASQLFGMNYLLNVVETPKKEIARVFCGDPQSAFEQGVRFFESERTIRITKKADCAIVSAGGYPKDRSFFLGHKAINSVTSCVEKGGAIILIAQCSEGIGNEKFSQYMLRNSVPELLSFPEEKIEVGGHRAFLTSKILNDYKVYVISDVAPKMLSQRNFIPADSMNTAIKQLKKDYGDDFKTYIVPDGKSILPVLNGN